MKDGNKAWFTSFKRGGSAPLRLFAFPFAGGGSAVFGKWSLELRGVDVFAAQLPGREGRIREPALTDMGELIAGLVPAILPLLDRPYVFFGHSLGALVAFELARTLVDRGFPEPEKLCVSAFRSPERPLTNRVLHDLPTDDFLRELKTYGGLPPQVLQVEELVRLLLPTLRADFRVFETHTFRPGSPLSCPIQAFYGERDAVVTKEHMLAWADKTTGSFGIHELPGDHFFVTSAWKQLLGVLFPGAAEARAAVHA